MANRKLTRDEWNPYFDVMTHALEGNRTEVEVAGLELGDQVEEDWLRLDGITFDPKDDALWVYTNVVNHAIAKPREIQVAERGAGIEAVSVSDAEGHVSIVRLRAPLMLPPPPRRPAGAEEARP